MRFQSYLTLPQNYGITTAPEVSGRLNGKVKPHKIGASHFSEWDGEIFFPPLIQGRFKIKAQFCPQRVCNVQIIERGLSLTPVNICDPPISASLTPSKAEDLRRYGRLESLTFEPQSLTSLEGELFQGFKWGALQTFARAFITPKENITVDVHYTEEGMIMRPPGRLRSMPIFFYGGYYREGCLLEEIEPLGFVPFSKGDHTDIKVSSLSEWIRRGVPLDGSFSREGFQFQTTLGESEALPLNRWLGEGGGEIKLPLGVDEKGSLGTAVYQSSGVAEKDTLTENITITFKHKENIWL